MSLLCPHLRRSWLGILVSGCPCVRSSRTMHARVLKFHIWTPHGKVADTRFFFFSELSPFLELCSFEKIRMKSDACHILWTVHARVLKFHTCIPHGKIADSYFISCPSYRPFWSYALWKKSEWNLMHAISYDPCMLGFWNLICAFLMEKKNYFLSELSPLSPLLELCPLKKSEWNLVSKISGKVFELGAWNLVSW